MAEKLNVRAIVEQSVARQKSDERLTRLCTELQNVKTAEDEKKLREAILYEFYHGDKV